jgi:hypothetical protein
MILKPRITVDLIVIHPRFTLSIQALSQPKKALTFLSWIKLETPDYMPKLLQKAFTLEILPLQIL